MKSRIEKEIPFSKLWVRLFAMLTVLIERPNVGPNVCNAFEIFGILSKVYEF
jgi:hypothetical protein